MKPNESSKYNPLRLRWSTTLVVFCVAAAGANELRADDITVSGPLYGVQYWRQTNTYHLDKFVYVMDGAELHIEPGTVIKGLPGTAAETAALIVTRGGKIFAEGTRTQPIIFTAEDDDVTDPEFLDTFERGLWGGVVLMGRAPINTAIDTDGNTADPKYDVFEGLPDLEVDGQPVHRFGGGDPHDSSGVLRYVSIRRAGVTFLPNKELNGLSLAGVGDGTTIEYVEVYAAADDGFEFFGGTVNTKYLVSAFNDDDAFDADQGHNGKHQFWFAIQEPGKKDNGGELNGEPNEVNAGNDPVANYQIWNATWIGAGADSSGNRGFTIRVYAAPRVYNSIITDFGGVAMRITDEKAGQYVASGLMQFRENLWFGFNADPIWADDYAAVFFQDGSYSNRVVDPQLRGISRQPDGGLDPRPSPGSPAWEPSTVLPPDDGFFTPVDYRGAFGPNDLWISGWTFLSQRGFVRVEAAPPHLSIEIDAERRIHIRFPTVAGFTYRVQAAETLAVDGWQDVGQPLTGTGAEVSFSEPVSGSHRFYRVMAE
ncbi:MAG: T9SS C-terminal target domain-containing protein [Verrucomicrobia bacterium]|nr:MAG: T9SS C-terminal target domain-containing protein [Verrucomicrobiota bacterium]